MGVYIKGMEMPATGLYIVSVDNTNGRDKTVATVERMLSNRDVRQIVGTFELVNVPAHGRLINEKYIVPKDGYIIADGIACVSVKDIVNAPTIIPAEPEEEEMK